MSELLRFIDWGALSPEARVSALSRPALDAHAELTSQVRAIIDEVRRDSDAALFRFTERFDGARLDSLEISEAEKREAKRQVSSEAREALERAASQIERFHRASLPVPIRMEVSPGLWCERVARPVERVGLYIPGGTAPLPSTVLMLGIPARLAGCPVRVLVSPPGKTGGLDPHLLFAAGLCGIDRIFKLGGAQAIAALAYGTASCPKVDKIFGPGNRWVTEAKSLVAMDPRGAAIDMPAGPSEVMVVGDEGASPDFIAADLLSQAEHGTDSQVILVTPCAKLLEATRSALAVQLEALPRRRIAEASLRHSRGIYVGELSEALEVANAYAPEHLILQVENPKQWVDRIQHAGSVFMGRWSPEAVGDYASGTNHVLPTYGFARVFSGVSVDSFLKQMTIQTLSPEALLDIGPVVETLASLEGLHAHRRAVTLRLEALRGGGDDRGQ